MTQEEFKNLKFGDRVYLQGSDGSLSIAVIVDYNHGYGEYSLTFVLPNQQYYDLDSIAPSQVFFEKPKKKVKKEITKYVSNHFINDIEDGKICTERWLMDEPADFYNRAITITYETEEKE